TPAGEDEARALAPILAGHGFEVVLTSPLQRARRTAELAGFPDAVLDDRLVELNYGDYEGKTSAEIRRERPDWFLWRDRTPNGESIEAAGKRADAVAADIGSLAGDALLFGHGHFTRILGARLLSLPPETGSRLILTPGSLSIVSHEHGERALRLWNAHKT